MLDASGGLDAILARFASVHDTIQRSLAELTDADLDLPTLWWEGRVTPLRFRMQRFDAHLREHTIQIGKTILDSDITVTEGARLARLVHRALGECEPAVIGTPAFTSPFHQDVDRQFALWNSVLPS